jgi:hypothetical protein
MNLQTLEKELWWSHNKLLFLLVDYKKKPIGEMVAIVKMGFMGMLEGSMSLWERRHL